MRRGYKLHHDISTLDTAATALDALGLSIPDDAPGRVVSEMYTD